MTFEMAFSETTKFFREMGKKFILVIYSINHRVLFITKQFKILNDLYHKIICYGMSLYYKIQKMNIMSNMD